MSRKPAPPANDDLVAVAIAYHEATKHHPQRYAAALGYLDWASQPDPFRSFPGASKLQLPRDVTFAPVAYDRLYGGTDVAPQPLSLAALADFLRQAMAVSAWKRWQTSRWALRVNPSSGNLHPTEAYLVLPATTEFGDAGVWHYAPRDHSLERRATVAATTWRQVLPRLADGECLLGLTSIVWREAWKYGERAFRYCQHDVGHALAALRLAARLHGWHLRLLPAWSHAATAALLGCDRVADFAPPEHEEPEALLLLAPLLLATGRGGAAPDEARTTEPDALALAAWRQSAWSPPANRLSREHHPWPILDAVAAATRMPATRGDDLVSVAHWPPPTDLGATLDARRIVQQRRSAVAFDGKSSTALATFVRLMQRALPGNAAPWDMWPWQPQVHLLLFVHRVDGLPPGLYFLARTRDVVAHLRPLTRPELHWAPVAEVPAELPLYRLWPGDYRRLANAVSCNQDIAADGFFSLGMLACFAPALRARGAWFYRPLFWETGLLGQVLYLEAEAVGARATGIGCFFDDSVHEVLGLRGDEFQSLYHFTVGIPVDDARLSTEPGYA